MKILDSHVHIFNSKVIENVVIRSELVRRLSLQKEGVYNRLDTNALLNDMSAANIRAALMLPTSDADNLLKTNRTFIRIAGEIPELLTAGTLHPDYEDIEGELEHLSKAGVRVIKFCSFSQGFSLDHPNTHRMFNKVQTFNGKTKKPFSVVLDTLTLADQYFGTDPNYTTTPKGLSDLVSCFSGINFIGAHMGGLGAVFERLDRDLKPSPNLFLDTSNASHTLSTDQFISMLHSFGPGHILFGTDWPWFIHNSEVKRIELLMDKAGFNRQEKEAVFGGNLENLLGITEKINEPIAN